MSLIALSLLAGILTILAPCVLPLLPVIIGGSIMDGRKSRPWIIIASFAVSVVFFTLIIKILVDQIGLYPETLTTISASILIIFGIVLLFPQLRWKIMHITGLERKTSQTSNTFSSGKSIKDDIILGAVLWPLFNTCSPTFIVLVSNILPVDFMTGLINILAYILWLVLVLSIVAYGGRAAISRLKRAAKPNSSIKKVIAIILILVGTAILMWWHKTAEAWMIQHGFYIDTVDREVQQIEQINTQYK